MGPNAEAAHFVATVESSDRRGHGLRHVHHSSPLPENLARGSCIIPQHGMLQFDVSESPDVLKISVVLDVMRLLTRNVSVLQSVVHVALLNVLLRHVHLAV